MITNLKTFAIAMLVTGATVATTQATPPAVTTNTQIIQNVSVNLTAYYEGSPSSTGKSLGDKTLGITTKQLISYLSSVTGNSFPGTGAAAPKLVLRTAYDQSESFAINEATATNSSIVLTNGTNLFIVVTNSGTGTNSTNALPFAASTNYFLSYVVTSNGIVTQITNTLATNSVPVGTNENYATLATNTILADVTNTTTNIVFTGDTNGGYFTVITPAINTNGYTNITFVTYVATNSSEQVFTNVTKTISVMYGTTPTFVDVDNYIAVMTATNANPAFNPGVEVETGSGLGATDATVATQTKIDIKDFMVAAVAPTGTNNLVLDVQGIVTEILKYDTLTLHATGTNALKEPTSSSSSWAFVTGVGTVGGTFATNTVITNSAGMNTNGAYIYPSEVPFYGIVGTNTYVGASTNLATNTYNGFLENPIPIVLKGTITVTYLKNLP